MTVDHHDSDERPAELFAIDRQTCVTLLTTQHVGRLVFGGDEPTIVPLNYHVADEVIHIRTEGAGRVANAAGGPVVFEADMLDSRTRSGWSVVVHGRLDVASEDAGDGPDVDTWVPGPRDLRMVLPVDEVTGRLVRGRVEAPTHPRGGYL